MSDLSIPFNITLLELTEDKLYGLKPVTSLDTLDGMTRNLHENGLFSISIFGRIGDERRNRRFSFIDIKATIFHPTVYRALVQLRAFYAEIIQGKSYAIWNDQLKDFEKSTQIDGKTGFHFFTQHWKDIVFEERSSDIRQIHIDLINKFKEITMISKVIVMPAGLRDIEIEEDNRMSENEINALYRKLLSLSNTITVSAVKNNIEILDGARFSMQNTFNQIYDMIENLIKGKKKLMMGKWASRSIHNGTRNVITSMDTKSDRINSTETVGFNDTMVGLYQYIKAITPVTIYSLRNGFLSNVFTGPSDPAFLVNKKTWKKEMVTIKSDYFDTWMSDEGLEKVITLFGEESIRHNELEIDGYYMGLIYKGPGVFKIFQDIDDLPEGYDKKYVSPLTFTELIYIAVYADSTKYPGLITRYPVTGFGSIYVSNMFLKPTVKTERRAPLGDDWQINPDQKVALQFPTKTDFLNSLSPHSAHLGRMGADFDGDTASLNILVFDESIAEVKEYMASARYYVGSDGRISFSAVTDTTKYILHNLTSDIT